MSDDLPTYEELDLLVDTDPIKLRDIAADLVRGIEAVERRLTAFLNEQEAANRKASRALDMAAEHIRNAGPVEWQWALRWDDGEIEPRDDERDARRTHQRYTRTTVIRREVRYGPWIDDENGDTP